MCRSKKLVKKLSLVLLSLKSLEPYNLYFQKESNIKISILDLKVKKNSVEALRIKIKKLKKNLSRYFLDLIYKEDERKTLETIILKNYIINFESLLKSSNKEFIQTLYYKSGPKVLNSEIQIKNVLPLKALNALEDYLSI